MANKINKKTVIKLQDASLGIEHCVPVGQVMLGHKPVDTDPGYDTVRHVNSFAKPLDGVMGLMDPTPHVNAHSHAFCTGVQIFQADGLAWGVFLTDGMGGGTDVEVDDPAHDILLASGTDRAYQKLNVELLPGQKIRVVCAVATTFDTRVIAMFANVIGPGGRLIA